LEKENTPVKLERSHQENIYKTIVSIALEITPKVYKSNFKNMVLIEISEVIRLKRGVSNIIKKIKQELKKNKGFDYYDFKIAASRNPWISEYICLDLKRNTFTKILDEKKILATIEEKKKQPTTENRFQRRMRKMQEMMEEAEKKQKLKRKR